VKIGYARVSIEEQNLGLQRDALERAGVARVFEDHAGSASKYRPGLDSTLAMLGPGDALVVWKLDRLGRSVKHLINLVHDLGERGIELVSLSENIDTTTPGGRLVFHMMGALAEFERSLIVERTKAGMASARSRGRHLGRSPSLNPFKIEHARMLIDSGASVSDTARTLNVGRSTLYRALRADGALA
jgi:DNA invertase Pin-like site-specific DNA recombinase